MAKVLGKPLHIDMATINKSKTSHEKVKVEVDLLKDFLRRINVKITCPSIARPVNFKDTRRTNVWFNARVENKECRGKESRRNKPLATRLYK